VSGGRAGHTAAYASGRLAARFIDASPQQFDSENHKSALEYLHYTNMHIK
jgi:hypothetical protein